MQKKIFAWAMSMAVAAMITCTGCTQNSSTSSGTDSETAQTTTLEETDGSVSSQNLSAVQSGTAGVTTDAGDLCDTYDSFDAEIALADDDTKVTGNTKAVSVKNNRVTISAGGTYQRQADKGTGSCHRFGKGEALSGRRRDHQPVRSGAGVRQ